MGEMEEVCITQELGSALCWGQAECGPWGCDSSLVLQSHGAGGAVKACFNHRQPPEATCGFWKGSCSGPFVPSPPLASPSQEVPAAVAGSGAACQDGQISRAILCHLGCSEELRAHERERGLPFPPKAGVQWCDQWAFCVSGKLPVLCDQNSPQHWREDRNGLEVVPFLFKVSQSTAHRMHQVLDVLYL